VDPDLRAALAEYLTGLGDNELVLGHRDSEWCGHAPILEEDIAFASLALDEIGHAMLWYGTLAELEGKDPDVYPDELVYSRAPREFRSVQLVALPPGDWAFSVMRRYLFDEAERVWLERLTRSGYIPMAQAAAKIRTEEIYHLRHMRAWVRRLGLGTEESRGRMQAALDELWTYALQLFVPLPGAGQLVGAGLIPDMGEMRQDWEQRVRAQLLDSGLQADPEAAQAVPGIRGEPGPHLPGLLAELQSVARQYPDARW
jgi:ring-1,2-phenylacetyl-CoA epoxidase subunit PaaC